MSDRPSTRSVSVATGQCVRVCLVNDTSNTNNWGARATSRALVSLIEEAGGAVAHTLYESRLTEPRHDDHRRLVDAMHTLDHQAFGTLMPRRIRRGLLNRVARYCPDATPASWAEFEGKAKAVMAGRLLPDIRAALEASDVVLISGEGCIYGNLRQSRLLFFIAYLAKCWLGRPTALVNHSAELSHPVLEEIAREVYPRLDAVVFREADSAAPWHSQFAPVVAADAAYRLAPAAREAWLPIAARPGYFDGWPCRAEHFDPSRPYVCVGGSSRYLRGGQECKNPANEYIALCRRLSEQVGQVVLMAAAWQDERIFREVARELDLPLVGIATPARQAIDILGNAMAYVGGRWHSGIFAHAGGTPVVALGAYTAKMQALLNHMQLAGEPFDPFELAAQAEAITTRTLDLIGQGEALRDTLRHGARLSAERAACNVGLLAADHSSPVMHREVS
ncbi:polysaccharide pyruvyl transferase family protein [Modicisalibacter tunisiensis]|uniref:polysaccharide pyruvyl transferase family protein n=1 Tax=Modicisalibacter tunisiensis TaxID=390637 RepID=UPI001CCC74F9|nr:polysaccharide pyruvyl transferase family protein [Modicisalibacter tunisiensis]MBZ9538045.1 polysaccharide pyruvyl transferase family protein [Modicisalibacter tunisiensis]